MSSSRFGAPYGPVRGVAYALREFPHLSLSSKRCVLSVVLALVAFSFLDRPVDVSAQWSNDPTVNTPVAVDEGPQMTSVACSDGAGGAIIAWVDDRAGPGQTDIYAQRLDAAGNPRWGVNGVPVCTAPWIQANPAITSDGAGGAIITWQDGRTPANLEDIWAQRVNADGDRLWTPDPPADPMNGIPVCLSVPPVTPASLQIWPMLVSDDAGGAIITVRRQPNKTDLAKN